MVGNKVLWTAILAWFVAQFIKVIIELILKKRFNLAKMLSSGGMPSSHSAMVVALATSVGIVHGTASTIFAICAVFAVVVMYDASGVRRETGEQAKIINQMVENWLDEDLEFEKKLKELVGHTPMEVFAGAALGMAIGFLMF